MPTLMQPSFAGGELSPDMYGRVDINKYAIGAKRLSNFFVHAHGGVSNRAGTKLVANTKDDGAAILIPFEFNLEQTYALEFGNEYVRFHSNGGQVVESGVAVTGATQANPVVITAVAHGYANGDQVYLQTLGGMVELNGGLYEVANVTTDTFELTGIDGTGFTAYTSGGNAFRVYEIASPFAAADLRKIKYTQSADVMTLVCEGYAPMELRRLGNTNWELIEINFVPTIERPDNVTVSTSSGGSTVYRYRVTAVSAQGAEESLAGLRDASKTITAATNANPIVITSSSHGFVAGDEVYIDGVGGMTELNGRAYRVGNVATNTFELSGVDGTDYGVYTSGGTATLTYAQVSSATLDTSGLTITVEWDDVADAERFNVYREVNGIYGYIGSADGLSFEDKNIIPDTSDTPPQFRIPYDVGNYPSVVEYFEQRLVFAKDQTIQMSQSANFKNFSSSIPLRDDDAVEFTLNAARVNSVRWLVPLNELLAMTSGGVWRINGTGGFITPSDVQAKRQGSYRVSDVKPIVVGTSVVYVSGKSVQDLAYSFDVDAYDGKDISILAEHLFENRTIVNWAFAQEPDNLIWAVMSDGKALTLTYLKEQEIFAWTRHETDGEFEDVVSVPEGEGDAVYFIVKRTINGEVKRFVERLAERDFIDIEDAFFVDCGLTYDGAPNDMISGLDHLEGEAVAVLADGNVVESMVVENGAITLPFEASVVHVGLPYSAKMNTLDVVYETRKGTSQGAFKTITKVVTKVRRTRGLQAGPYESDNLVEIKQRENEVYGNPTEMTSGDLEVTIEPDWRTEASIWLVQDYPLPCTILNIVPEVGHGG